MTARPERQLWTGQYALLGIDRDVIREFGFGALRWSVIGTRVNPWLQVGLLHIDDVYGRLVGRHGERMSMKDMSNAKGKLSGGVREARTSCSFEGIGPLRTLRAGSFT